MMIRHHPSDDLLLAYATGMLGEGHSLLVATHLALCPRCRAEVAHLEAVGGALVEDLPPADVAEDALNAVLARLDEPASHGQVELAPSPFADDGSRAIPEPLRGYLDGRLDTLAWRRLGPGVRQHALIPRRNGVATRLLRIAPGTALPEHGHEGGEHTLVLCGSFYDEDGQFARGDVESADGDTVHRPIAGPDADCICLVVTEAPLRFTGLMGRILQPFVRF